MTALYQAHALGLIRLAVVMLGDRPAAEDVVQEAFCGLYRRWHSLADTGKALAYVRSSVINGCRTVLRRRLRQPGVNPLTGDPPGESAEAGIITYTTGFPEFSAATGRVTRILGHWNPDQRHEPMAGELLWSGTSGRVLIGVIHAGGRDWVGVISGNESTPLNARWALSMTQGLNDFGTW